MTLTAAKTLVQPNPLSLLPEPIVELCLEGAADLGFSEHRLLQKAIERDWFGLVTLFGRKHGPWIFGVVARYLRDDEYWPLLSDVWGMVEWPPESLRRFLRSQRPRRELMMTERDRLALDRMADPVRVFRGGSSRRAGWSWTTDENVAHWFARSRALSYGAQFLPSVVKCSGKVLTGIVAKRDVIAYLHDPGNRRGEWEILTEPRSVRVESVCAADATKADAAQVEIRDRATPPETQPATT